MKGNISDRLGLLPADLEALINAITATPEVEDIIIYGSRAKSCYRTFSDIDITLSGKRLSHTDLFPIMDRIDELNLPYETDISLFSEIDCEELRAEIERYGVSLLDRERICDPGINEL